MKPINQNKMEKTQTAVEWLVKELNQKIDYIPINKWDEIRDIVQQAKAMEKEQIIDALMTSEVELLSWGISAEQYYNETYGSK